MSFFDKLFNRKREQIEEEVKFEIPDTFEITSIDLTVLAQKMN